ncbi:LytR/AlgR family response regulator transcription factor [Anaerotignum sp.]|uniref:LytR/AlgR family response regulator transcription factor n=1 Tax=Anaerotignum sp. TaxID=2039241 RepID=UPI002714D71F|nr:LytTR family transcriptional regulator DNA-binding domain-containing protein [Anaerotignum sp.]
MLRVILVDDELPALDELSYQLSKFEQIEMIAQFTDPIMALKQIEQIEPDVVFLDIEMPILNGLNLATELLEQDKSFSIVFITAYNHYALQAFEVNAVDYIVKPVRVSRLKQTVEKLQKNMENNVRHTPQLMKQMKDTVNEAADKLVVFDGENYHFIEYEEIIYIEARMKISEVVTRKGAYSTKKTMNVMEERLRSHGFFRCHRSYIINPKHIIKIMPSSSGTFQIKLNHSPLIPVSKPHTMEVKKIIERME